MKWINRICTIVCLLIIAFVVLHKMLLIEVPLGQVGVLTQQYGMPGSPKGLKAKDYAPGWHLDLGPIHQWTLFDATTQTILVGTDSGEGRRGNALRLKSADGYSVDLDITIKYKIMPEHVHQLYATVSGSQSALKSLVQNEALDTFRAVFGNMKTEDFYNPQARLTQNEKAFANLTQKLERRHVRLIDILVRDIMFDPQYEKKIQDKKLADQDVEVNKSQSLAAQKKGETLVIEAEADAMVKVIEKERDGELLKMKAQTDKEIAQIKAEADKYATQVRADADLYAAEQIAQGTQVLKEAQAEGEKLKAQALQGTGGANLVALEAAGNLTLGTMTLSTLQTDFMDVDAMARQLGAQK